jgi:hypothetical protein
MWFDVELSIDSMRYTANMDVDQKFEVYSSNGLARYNNLIKILDIYIEPVIIDYEDEIEIDVSNIYNLMIKIHNNRILI